MASCICHVVCAPMWRRLERLVRPPLPGTCAGSAAPQHLSRNSTASLRGKRGAGPCWAEPRHHSSRRQKLSPSASRDRLGAIVLVPKLHLSEAELRPIDRRCLHRACKMPTATDEREVPSDRRYCCDGAGNKA